ncbi:hypothetical protein F5B17DRAFT_226072 [Nemania serpens]|nr:hypothetical protein F5B17DRAFT_226072 [Nemania serpens]
MYLRHTKCSRFTFASLGPYLDLTIPGTRLVISTKPQTFFSIAHLRSTAVVVNLTLFFSLQTLIPFRSPPLFPSPSLSPSPSPSYVFLVVGALHPPTYLLIASHSTTLVCPSALIPTPPRLSPSSPVVADFKSISNLPRVTTRPSVRTLRFPFLCQL